MSEISSLKIGSMDTSIHKDLNGDEHMIVNDKKLKVVDIGTNKKQLYIYQIHRPGEIIRYNGDICYGMMGCSESEEKARRIHPNEWSFDEEKQLWYKEWPEDHMNPNILKKIYIEEDDYWIRPNEISMLKVKQWGIATRGEEGEVIMSDISFGR